MRQIVHHILVIVGFGWGPYCTSHAQQPNFVIFLSDDHGREDVGCYGNPDVKTPVMDQLAREGMRFKRAYTPVSVCAPSRSALFTGLYPYRNGCDRNHGAAFSHIRSLPHYLATAGYEVILAGKEHIRPRSAFPFLYMERHEIPEYLNQKRDGPFCLIVSLNAPHQPYFNLKGGHGRVHPKPWLPTTPETGQYMAAYYDHVALADQEIGAILYWLERYGWQENSIQLYLSDHGPAFPFAKWTLYDQGIRVPLIIKWPGVVKPGSTSDALVSMVDILPTLLDMAGIDYGCVFDGKSITPLLKQEEISIRDAVYACYTNLGVQGANDYPIRAVVTNRHKLIVNLRPDNAFALQAMDRPDERAVIDAHAVLQSWSASENAWANKRAYSYRSRPFVELYDLVEDPYELTNCAADEFGLDVVLQLYQQLTDWMKDQQDPLWNQMVSNKKNLYQP